jgi:hypothetical protein
VISTITLTVLKKNVKTVYSRNKKRRYYSEYKPWFTEDYKELDKQYLTSLDEFNKNRSNEIRLKLNVAKQNYSVTENKLNKQCSNQQGNMMNTLRLLKVNQILQKKILYLNCHDHYRLC